MAQPKEPMRWGFVGAGNIVRLFIEGLKQVEDAKVTAVYDKYIEAADKFAAEQGIEHTFDDIDAFLESGLFDIVYIAVPHPLHLEFAKRALNAKFPVLCEKPICPTAKQVRELIACAKENDCFLMEAFWQRFFPVSRQVCAWIEQGKIGELVAADGVFTFVGPCVPGNRLYEPAAAGGSLLDIGTYLVNYMNMVFQTQPEKMTAVAQMTPSGVDRAAAFAFAYKEGGVASFLTSFDADSQEGMSIIGTKGVIHVDAHYWRPHSASLMTEDTTTRFECKVEGRGFQYEVMHVQDCIRKGLKESPVMPLADSLGDMETCDTLRQIMGVVYPFE